MSTATAANDWFERLLNMQARPQPVPGWLEELRQQAKRTAAAAGLPHRKQEAWKYTAIDKLVRHEFLHADIFEQYALRVDVAVPEIPGLDSHRLVFVDGVLRTDLSRLGELPPGLRLLDLAQAVRTDDGALADYFGRTADSGSNAFVALNTALAGNGVFISIDAGVRVEKPIELVFLTSAASETITSLPRNIVHLQTGAEATLIERFGSAGRSFYFQNLVAEISLAEAAQLRHYRFIQEQDQAFHLSSIFVNQQETSIYDSVNLELSGAWVRTDYHVGLAGRQARTSLNGLYLVNSGQLADVHTNIEHHAAACTSTEKFRGLLLGSGRAVFDGRILVQREAQETDASMANDNLLLSANAEVDTKPQLEIYADNVKCSHGTTVGQIDPEQIFYLRSRGISAELARHMICQGFAVAVTDIIREEPVREFARSAISGALEQALGFEHGA